MNIYKSLRQKSGLTQVELAKRLNVNQATVSKWEKGKSVPDIVTLKDLSNLFEVSIETLLGYNTTNAEKKEVSELTPQQKILLENITKLTDIECIKVNGYIEGLILNRINEKHSTLINISEE